MSSPIATPAAAAAGGSGPAPDGGDAPQDLRLLWSMIWIPAAILLLLVLLPLGVNLLGGWHDTGRGAFYGGGACGYAAAAAHGVANDAHLRMLH